MSIICAVNPVFLAGADAAELFAVDVAAVVGIGRSIVANAVVNAGKTGDIKPADNVFVGVFCGFDFVSAGRNLKLWGVVFGAGVGAVVRGDYNAAGATGGAVVLAVLVASRKADHKQSHKQGNNGDRNAFLRNLFGFHHHKILSEFLSGFAKGKFTQLNNTIKSQEKQAHIYNLH